MNKKRGLEVKKTKSWLKTKTGGKKEEKARKGFHFALSKKGRKKRKTRGNMERRNRFSEEKWLCLYKERVTFHRYFSFRFLF